MRATETESETSGFFAPREDCSHRDPSPPRTGEKGLDWREHRDSLTFGLRHPCVNPIPPLASP